MIIYTLDDKIDAGTFTTDPIAIPLVAATMKISAFRDKWPVGKGIISFMCDVSLNNGATWLNDFAGFTTKGGTIRGRTRKEIKSLSFVSFPVPHNMGPQQNRLVRLRINCLKKLKTVITIETFP